MLLVACGVSPQAPEILPPNIEQACMRAESCGVFAPEQRASCVVCLEHLPPEASEWIDAQDIPPLEQVDCDTILAAAQSINLTKCVGARWYDHD
jgi:hypothetical protein